MKNYGTFCPLSDHSHYQIMEIKRCVVHLENHRTVSRSGNSRLHLSTTQYASYAKVANAAMPK